jgi:antitoxin VapB
MTIAKVFKNGRSQAIRLPKEFRVSGGEVYLKKAPQGFLVIPRDPWEIFAEGVAEISEDALPDRAGLVEQRRDWPE